MNKFIIFMLGVLIYACGKSKSPDEVYPDGKVPQAEEEGGIFKFEALERVGYFDASLKFEYQHADGGGANEYANALQFAEMQAGNIF
ncbi:hypothetical protein [Sphingobacterium pedocola]|nr:hypothetical protein [Sphingobacterium pedocola]